MLSGNYLRYSYRQYSLTTINFRKVEVSKTDSKSSSSIKCLKILCHLWLMCWTVAWIPAIASHSKVLELENLLNTYIKITLTAKCTIKYTNCLHNTARKQSVMVSLLRSHTVLFNTHKNITNQNSHLVSKNAPIKWTNKFHSSLLRHKFQSKWNSSFYFCLNTYSQPPDNKYTYPLK